MKFNILDMKVTYRRLMAETDAAQREAIFCQEIVEPFKPLMTTFGGGGDPLATFKMWGMSPDQFVGDDGAQQTAIVENLAAYGAFEKAAAALDTAWAAFAPYASEIPTQEITFGLMAFKSHNPNDNPRQGYAGFGAIPGYIMTTYSDANDYTLPRVQAATGHELHHNLLFAARPKNFMTETTVADYMIYEGLAESFATELYGEDVVGYFVTDFDESKMDTTKAIMRAGLEKTGFNVIRHYIFGDNIMTEQMGIEPLGLPEYAGYALGYRIVQAYIRKTGKSVVETTFVPANEIIATSGFFE